MMVWELQDGPNAHYQLIDVTDSHDYNRIYANIVRSGTWCWWITGDPVTGRRGSGESAFLMDAMNAVREALGQ